MFLSAITANSNTILASTAGDAVLAETQPAVVVTVFKAYPNASSSSESKKATKPIVSVEQYVKTYFSKNPIMAEISRCESEYRHFVKNGEVLRGRAVREDVGIMQVNETYHKADSEKLGYNIYTLDGNLAYAQYLYEKQGTRPWNSSKACWGKYE